MREIVLDTETTGLDPTAGHRIVEVGCLELVNHMPTGRVFHRYINPERDMPAEAFAVHGLSEQFLSGHPVFAAIAGDLVEFLEDSPLVIHNAEFDLKFLNWEFRQLERPPLAKDRAIDTIQIARRRFPGAPASLDALCRRFAIDNSARDKHGALLDAELLADVYLELIGGREPGLQLSGSGRQTRAVGAPRQKRDARPHAPTEEEQAAHDAFVKTLTNPLWPA
jgi:DNA polymerase-3 subunit epsilon